MDNKLTTVRALPLDSECKVEFLYSSQEKKIIPVLMITGIKAMGGNPERIWSDIANGHIGIVNSGYNSTTKQTYVDIVGENDEQPIEVMPYINASKPGDWLLITEQQLQNKTYEIVYPRVAINSLNIKTNSESLILKYRTKDDSTNADVLQQYKDYSILSRPLQNKYFLTLNNNLVLKNNYLVSKINDNIKLYRLEQLLYLNYIMSNADTSIYLDALQIAKENSRPKVSYNVKLEYINQNFIKSVPNLLGYLTTINDTDLKFKNVKGYVSSVTLDLDNPEQDSIQIKNYKTKFEDLFSTIAVQTEAMKKNSQILEFANTAFTSQGNLSQQVLQSSIKKVDLNYAFNNGKLTIDEKNGIWGTSDSGVVAFRGGGIFTATEKNADETWKWNTGITPEGINADLITSGQLDTNLIKIYAGDHLRFQMNGDGIFAYKSKISDAQDDKHPELEGSLAPKDSADPKQYVVFNDNGLSLIAKKGAKVLTSDKNHYFTVLNDDYIYEEGKHRQHLAELEEITRVEVSWDGFILRNWQNERVFYADPETGNLTIKGHIEATTGKIGSWEFNSQRMWAMSKIITTGSDEPELNSVYTNYVALNSGGNQHEIINQQQVDTRPFAFWAGNENPEYAALYIRKDGYIQAAAGKIGGWNINSTRIYTPTVSLFSGVITSIQGTNVVTESAGGDSNQVTVKNIANGKISAAVLWVHGEEKINGITSTSYDADHSKFHINTNGEVMAQDFYLITNNNNTGKISTFKSIKKWLEALESSINDIYSRILQ